MIAGGGKTTILRIAREARTKGDEERVALCNVAIGWADDLEAYARVLADRRGTGYRDAVVSMAERDWTVSHDLDCDVLAVRAWCRLVLDA